MGVAVLIPFTKLFSAFFLSFDQKMLKLFTRFLSVDARTGMIIQMVSLCSVCPSGVSEIYPEVVKADVLRQI